MNLKFNLKLISYYKSNSQIARILTEDWVLNNSYCPCCGNKKLEKYSNNKPVLDFYCSKCNSNFELKSSKTLSENKIVDGAYSTMIDRIKDFNNPNFFFLSYSEGFCVVNFYTIPKHFFIPNIIGKRKPLNLNARRAGWVGCNILLKEIPISGRIFMVKDKKIINSNNVIEQWKNTEFLKTTELENRGWLLEIISIIDKISNQIFTLSEIYKYKEYLKRRFPNNQFIKEKIRQQLQFLRNKGYIKFIGKGIYQRS